MIKFQQLQLMSHLLEISKSLMFLKIFSEFPDSLTMIVPRKDLSTRITRIQLSDLPLLRQVAILSSDKGKIRFTILN